MFLMFSVRTRIISLEGWELDKCTLDESNLPAKHLQIFGATPTDVCRFGPYGQTDFPG